MIRRREFITLLGGAATWPLAASAEQPAKVPRVGILSPAPNETAATLTAFREGIRDLGYVEGQTIELDFRLSKGIMDVLPALAAELVRIPVNVIVTDSTSGTLAAFAATRTSRKVTVICTFVDVATRAAMAVTKTIPIVFGTASCNRPSSSWSSISQPPRQSG
jgi:ABC-type uncharacterized transport system substrate-binding protein